MKIKRVLEFKANIRKERVTGTMADNHLTRETIYNLGHSEELRNIRYLRNNKFYKGNHDHRAPTHLTSQSLRHLLIVALN